MSNSRTRMAAIAGSLALSLSVALAPGAMATSESPEAAVEGLLAAIEAKDFEALPSFFTPELADEMGGLDFASVAEEMPEGLDAQMFLDALLFEFEAESEDISEEISLVLADDGCWLINSELGGDDEMMVEDMSSEDSSDEMTEETTEEMTEEESGEGDA